MKSIKERAVEALGSNGYETERPGLAEALHWLTDAQVETLFRCAARLAAKDGPEGFRLWDEDEE